MYLNCLQFDHFKWIQLYGMKEHHHLLYKYRALAIPSIDQSESEWSGLPLHTSLKLEHLYQNTGLEQIRGSSETVGAISHNVFKAKNSKFTREMQ